MKTIEVIIKSVEDYYESDVPDMFTDGWKIVSKSGNKDMRKRKVQDYFVAELEDTLIMEAMNLK